MAFQLETLSATPRGCLTLLPGLSERKRYMESILLERMRSWGYKEIVTPIFEYLDTVAPAVTEDLLKSAYKLTDRQSGRIMLLRADITPQIARIATTSLKDVRPLRFSYSLNVFRYEEEHGGRQREIYQIGAELIGVKGPEADAEIISVLSELLEVSGLKDYRIIVSHTEFLEGMLEVIGLTDEYKKIFLSKNISGIEEIQRDGIITSEKAELLKRVFFLYGEEKVLDEVLGLPLNEKAKRAVGELKEICEFLSIYGVNNKVLFDLSEAKGFEYHTGVVFEVVVGELKQPLGFGGRYDTVMEKFGQASSATGFSIDLAQLVELSRIEPPLQPSVYIVDLTGDKRSAVSLAKVLREKGFYVARDIIKRPFRDSIKYAEYEGYNLVIKIDTGYRLEVISTGYSPESLVNKINEILKEVKWQRQ
jgi:ATP phosphoribosyltransferase regulatory subunit